MSTDTNDAFLIRLGQTWKETSPVSGTRVRVMEKVQGDVAHLRTVFDEGYLGHVEKLVRVQTLLEDCAAWELLCPSQRSV